MRPILALATTGRLFAPGCGESSTAADMQMTVIDMTVTSTADMTKSCKAVLTCAQKCLGQADITGCAKACAMTASPAVQQTFGKLEGCLLMFCGLDASTTGIAACFQGALGDPNKCATEF